MKKTKQVTGMTLAVLLVMGSSLALAQRPERGGRNQRQGRAEGLNRVDENRDGVISREEAGRHGAQRFQKMDIDGDGVLSPAELQQGRSSRRGAARKQGFEKVDANGDGTIQSNEFRGGADAFAKLDSNGDGNLSAEELKSGRGQGTRPGRGGRDVFGRLDTNQDGKLDRGEFRGDDEQFGRLDANKDGWLSTDELKNAVKRRGGR